MPKPRLDALAVELTLGCNQACPHCYNPPGIPLAAPPAEVVLERLARIVAAVEVGRITLTGGEPLTYPGLIPVLEWILEQGISAQLISNGQLVTPELAARLRALQVRSVQLTLNGPDAETHDRHAGRGGFTATITGARALRGAGVPLVGCVVVTSVSARHVGAILAQWEELGAVAVALSRFSPAGRGSTAADRLLPSVPDLELAFAQGAEFARRTGLLVASTMPLPPCVFDATAYAPVRFGTCAVGTPAQEFALGVDGALRHCTLHRRPLAGGVDVRAPELDVAALIGSPEVTLYRGSILDFCRGCAFESTCGGGCAAAAEWATGVARQYPDPLLLRYLTPEEAREPAAPVTSGA